MILMTRLLVVSRLQLFVSFVIVRADAYPNRVNHGFHIVDKDKAGLGSSPAYIICIIIDEAGLMDSEGQVRWPQLE